MSASDVRPDERWQHIGGDGVNGTGLVVRICELGRDSRGPFFTGDYPELGNSPPRRYRGTSLGPRYQRIA